MKIGKANESMEEYEGTAIPFGKHKGEEITEVPDKYLEWLVDQDWFNKKFEALSQKINDELTTRDQQGDYIEDDFEANDLPWYDFDGPSFDPYD